MGFIDDLKKGLPGIQLAVPDAWKRQEEHDRRVVLVDSAHRVGWHILHAPWRADLRPTSAEVRRRDILRHARFGFEQHYHQVPVPKGTQRPPARTLDPAFSPLISMEYIDFCGVPALFCIRRVAHEQLMEAVVGNILIPLATGVIDITAFQHTQETGYRETNLLNMAMQKYPGEGLQKLAQRLGQAHCGDLHAYTTKRHAQRPGPLGDRDLTARGHDDTRIQRNAADQCDAQGIGGDLGDTGGLPQVGEQEGEHRHGHPHPDPLQPLGSAELVDPVGDRLEPLPDQLHSPVAGRADQTHPQHHRSE